MVIPALVQWIYKAKEEEQMAGDIRQISVFINNKSVVELMNKLHITTPGKGCRLHNEGDRNSNNSLIGINLVDYSVDPSVFVSDNITPSQLRELYYEAILKRDDYKFNTSKIFGEPDKDGYCTTRIMRINRQRSYVQNGRTIEKNYPWTITVENGKGIKAINQYTGGSSIKKGTYIREKAASAVLSDGDFFALFDKAVRFVEAWEAAYAPKFIAATIDAIAKADKEWQSRGQDGPDTGQSTESNGYSE